MELLEKLPEEQKKIITESGYSRINVWLQQNCNLLEKKYWARHLFQEEEKAEAEDTRRQKERFTLVPPVDTTGDGCPKGLNLPLWKIWGHLKVSVSTPVVCFIHIQVAGISKWIFLSTWLDMLVLLILKNTVEKITSIIGVLWLSVLYALHLVLPGIAVTF